MPLRRVVAGAINSGPESGGNRLTTDPLYLDVTLPANAQLQLPVTPGHQVLVYVYEGTVAIGDGPEARRISAHAAGMLGAGDMLAVRSDSGEARFLILAGRPLREPIEQYGPFVMNTREEIEQAIRDYQAGTLTQ